MAGVTTSPPSTPEGRLRRLPATLCIRNHTATTGCSKAHRVFSPTEVRGLFVHVMWLHRAAGGDSGALVVPFMHVGTYPTRHLATLRESELLPALLRPLAQLNPGFRYHHWPGYRGHTHPFGLATTCVFIKQSGPLVTATCSSCSSQTAGTPYTIAWSYFAEFPRLTVCPTDLRLLIQGTSVGSRTVLKESSSFCFHCLLDSSEPSLRKAIRISP